MKRNFLLKTLFLFLAISLIACSKSDNTFKETEEPETKYYSLNMDKIVSFVGASYDVTSSSLKDFLHKEKTSVGVRTGEYLLKDGETLFVLELQESSDKKVSKITIEPSYMMYNREEQLEMFVKYIQQAESKFKFSNASHEPLYPTSLPLQFANSVDELLKRLQDNPTLRKDKTIMVKFKNNSNTEIMYWYILNKFGITIQ